MNMENMVLDCRKGNHNHQNRQMHARSLGAIEFEKKIIKGNLKQNRLDSMGGLRPFINVLGLL